MYDCTTHGVAVSSAIAVVGTWKSFEWFGVYIYKSIVNDLRHGLTAWNREREYLTTEKDNFMYVCVDKLDDKCAHDLTADDVRSLLTSLLSSSATTTTASQLPFEIRNKARFAKGKSLLIYICNFHVLNHLLLIYICKLHWNLNSGVCTPVWLRPFRWCHRSSSSLVEIPVPHDESA